MLNQATPRGARRARSLSARKEAEGLGEEAGNGHRSVTVRSDFPPPRWRHPASSGSCSPHLHGGVRSSPRSRSCGAGGPRTTQRGAEHQHDERRRRVQRRVEVVLRQVDERVGDPERVVADAEQARAREEPVDEALPDEDVDQPRDQGLGS